MNPQVEALLAKAIEPSSVVTNGRYTSPRTWGVYEVDVAAPSRVRFGNHPVRQQELVREFGKVNLIALYWARPLAQKLAQLLNDGVAKLR